MILVPRNGPVGVSAYAHLRPRVSTVLFVQEELSVPLLESNEM